MTPTIAIIEALTTGTGFEVVKAARRRGFEVIFITRDPMRYQNLWDQELRSQVTEVVAETRSGDELIKAVDELRKTHQIIGLVGMSDGAIETVAQVAHSFGYPFGNYDGIRNARNKDQTRIIASRLGLLSPEIRIAHDEEGAERAGEEIGFPCIIKASRGTGSAQVQLCFTKADCRRAAHLFSLNDGLRGAVLIVEEFVRGPLFSLETITFNGLTKVLGVTDRVMGALPYFPEIADSFPIRFDEDQLKKVTSAVGAILQGIGFDYGFSHTEFVLSERGPCVIEVNPRLGGGFIGEMISIAYETDVYDALIDLAIGVEPRLPDTPIRGAAEWAVYASSPGTVQSVRGIDLANGYPFVKRIIVTSPPGTVVQSHGDFRAQIANVLAVGDTAEMASYYARAAATAISADIR
jgi:biotin carboxylase